MPRFYAVLCAFCLALGFTVGRLPQFARSSPPAEQTADDVTAEGKALTQGLIGGPRPELTPDERWVVLNAYAERMKGNLSEADLQKVCDVVKIAAEARLVLTAIRSGRGKR